MLKKTHRAWAIAWWLGGTLALDAVAADLGRAAVVHPGAVAAGAFIAPVFSAGRWLSPDMDHRWWPGPPRRGYPWRGHRGVTHRPWFAAVLTLVFGVVPYAVAVWAGVPAPGAAVVFAPVAGWWSHLSGDMIYGRLPVWGVAVRWRLVPVAGGDAVWRRRVVWWRFIVGFGWSTGGVLERGGRWWRDPAAGVCGALSVVLVGAHLALFVNG